MDVDIPQEVEDQIERQGVAAFRVKDGEVLVFTRKTLTKLLKASENAERAIVFVKHRPRA